MKIKTVQLIHPIKEPKIKRGGFSELKRLTSDMFDLKYNSKEKFLILDNLVLIPIENVSYMIIDADEDKV